MAENTEYNPLPADLPEDWTVGQTVAPAGADVGLSEQHGYNYLNAQVNAAQRAANQLQEEKASKEEVEDAVGAVHGLPAGGAEGQVLAKTGEEDGQAGWQDAVGKSLAGQTVEPAQGQTVTAGAGAEIFNDYRPRTYNADGTPAQGNVASGARSHAEGDRTTASQGWAHAEGFRTSASGQVSHAEGGMTIASEQYSHAEGNNTTASGRNSHAEGYSTTASGSTSHASGASTEALGEYSFTEGSKTSATGYCSHAAGCGTIANHLQFVTGTYNVNTGAPNDNDGNRFIVGGGTLSGTRKNSFRVHTEGVYGVGAWHSSGADYAELFEWLDGNPDHQDRAGLFVTLQGDRIRPASPDDDYILGIVSGSPSVVGDVYDDQWAGMFLTDVFGRPLYEDVDLPAEYGPDGEEILPARTERRQKLNPAYDHTVKYLPRTQRPEWDAVGLLGKLVAVDDGTCVSDGWCTVGEGGRATASETRTKYRVMARLDENHIRVMIL